LSAVKPIPEPARIRLATEQDVDKLHAMILALAKATGLREKVTSRPEDFRRFGSRGQPAFQALIAEQGTEAVGLALFFYSFSSWRGELGVYVQDLFVSDTVRGTGLGRRLVIETARLAKKRGATYLRLSVAKENVAAQKFYRGIGLSLSADECIYQAMGAAFDKLTIRPDRGKPETL
jgi:ribosomal protein S18 acetylase RimI-like enzyme